MIFPCQPIPKFGYTEFNCARTRDGIEFDVYQMVFIKMMPINSSPAFYWYNISGVDDEGIEAWLADLFPTIGFNRSARRLWMSAADNVKLLMMAA